jgi:alanine racemase
MDESLLKSLNSMAKKASRKAMIHIKVDTGMSRLGLDYDVARKFIRKAAGLKNIKIEGVYSHFSSAESNYIYTFFQIHRFKSLLLSIANDNIDVRLAHLCNSAALVNFKDAHLDLVRAGLLLYGIKPHNRLKISVKPVLSLKAKIIHVRSLPKGSFISYANTFRTKRDTLVGVVSCGYAYGFPWNLSGKARVLVQGKACRVLGRICMDHIVVDLSSLRSSVKVGQAVTLIGADKKKAITAEALAKDARTIPYEIVSGLSQDIKRVYKSV